MVVNCYALGSLLLLWPHFGITARGSCTLGYRAAGDADTLQQLGKQYGMRVEILDLVSTSGEPIISKVSTSQVVTIDNRNTQCIAQFSTYILIPFDY